MRPSPRAVTLVICAFVILEVALGLIFPEAAWLWVRWVGGVGLVIACAVLAIRWRAP